MPFNRSSWPGRIEREVSSFGAPRKIEGIKSKKVWVIVKETIKIRRKRGLIAEKKVRFARINEQTRFMCIPGSNPEIVPIRIPDRSERISSNILSYLLEFAVDCYSL